MQPGPATRFEALDVLRGLAAACVVVTHYSAHCARYFGAGPFGVQLAPMYGFYAVELFFMISGFVISFTLERGGTTWLDFAVSRVTRLYPGYWTALTLMVVLENVLFGKPFWVGGYVVNLTMFQEFVGFQNFDLVFWSLTVELVFYVIMGLLFATGLLPRIELVTAIWLVLACLWSVVDQYLGILLSAALPRLLILRHVPFFVAGIVFSRIAAKGPTPTRLALLLAALAAAGLIDGFWDPAVVAVEWTAVLRRLSVAAILFSIFALAVTGRLRFAISPVTLWLGTISYSLYLTHHNLGYSTLFRLHDAGVAISTSFLITLAGAVILAVVLNQVVERPAIRMLRLWYRTRSPAGIARP